MVNLVYELLCKNKISVDWLYFKLDADIKNILIDEFQDTSVYQYKIMLPLINEIVSGLGQNGIGSFFYVGDVKQSIYKFRDAKKELFDTLALKFKQIQILPLDTNYRSKSEIVDFVNNTFRDTISGFEQDQKSVKNGGFVEICDFETFEGESKFDEFLELLGKKVRFFVDNGALLNEIAILCQNNKDCELIKDYLQLNNINAYINAKSLLINTMPVRLVLEYLRYCLFGDNAYGKALEIVLGKKVAKLNLNIKDLPSTLKYL
nr:UvrD-helicase domain-containing protein [Campylobacter sp.]